MSQSTIAIESPLTDDARVLIAGSDKAMRAVFSEDECFTFSPEELDKPSIAFFVARQNGVAKGCVALVSNAKYGEVKRLFVPDSARGLGIAKSLMTHLESHARSNKIDKINLETGPQLAAAVSLYTALGYATCPAFGNYKTISASLFMEKSLS